MNLLILLGLTEALCHWAAVDAQTSLPSSSCSDNAVSIINGDFELPVNPSVGSFNYTQTEVPGWKTTSSDGQISILTSGVDGIDSYSGNQYVLMAPSSGGYIYQDVAATAGTTLYWRAAHRTPPSNETVSLEIGPPEEPVQQGNLDTGWQTFSGVYTVPVGQSLTRFALRFGSSAESANFVDAAYFGTKPCVEVQQEAIRPEGPRVAIDDVITFSLTVAHRGGPAEDATLENVIPEGADYVAGSMELTVDGTTTALTDAEDNDKGAFVDGKVVIHLGTLQLTEEGYASIVVTFSVKITGIGVVRNEATLSYINNLGENEARHEVTSNVIELDVTTTSTSTPGEETTGGDCNYVLKIVHVQDMTASYADDLVNMVKQMNRVLTYLQEHFPGSTISFTTFEDKNIPYSGEFVEMGYDPSYCFLVHNSLDKPLSVYKEALESHFTGGGNDWREASGEALLRVPFTKKIKLPPTNVTHDDASGRPIYRLVIFYSDALPQELGNAAKHIREYVKKNPDSRFKDHVLVPNSIAEDSVVLDDDENFGCDLFEYPAFHKIGDALKAANIIPIFMIGPALLVRTDGTQVLPVELQKKGYNLTEASTAMVKEYRDVLNEMGLHDAIIHPTESDNVHFFENFKTVIEKAVPPAECIPLRR